VISRDGTCLASQWCASEPEAAYLLHWSLTLAYRRRFNAIATDALTAVVRLGGAWGDESVMLGMQDD
jgi:hypothetical protein